MNSAGSLGWQSQGVTQLPQLYLLSSSTCPATLNALRLWHRKWGQHSLMSVPFVKAMPSTHARTCAPAWMKQYACRLPFPASYGAKSWPAEFPSADPTITKKLTTFLPIWTLARAYTPSTTIASTSQHLSPTRLLAGSHLTRLVTALLLPEAPLCRSVQDREAALQSHWRTWRWAWRWQGWCGSETWKLLEQKVKEARACGKTGATRGREGIKSRINWPVGKRVQS